MKGERKSFIGQIEEAPVIGVVIEKITDTAFSAKIEDRHLRAAKRVANDLGISESDAVRELSKFALYAAFSPLLGKKLTEAVKKSLRRK